MLSDGYGEEEVIDFSPEAATQGALSDAVTQIDVTPMGNYQVVVPRDESEVVEEYVPPEPPENPKPREVQDSAWPSVEAKPLDWSLQHEQEVMPEVGSQAAPSQPAQPAPQQAPGSQPISPPMNYRAVRPDRKQDSQQDEPSRRRMPTLGDFLRHRYGTNTTTQTDVGGFTYSGQQSSAKEEQKQTAGRPQPTPASGFPSHPFPLLGYAPPSLPEPEDVDAPDDPSLGQFPQEGKRRENTAHADNLAESLDMAAEQMLSAMDRMAMKLQSVSQRLVILESIVDRTY